MSNEYTWASDDPDTFRFTPGVDQTSRQESEHGYRRHPEYNLLKLERPEMQMLDPDEGLKSFAEVVHGFDYNQAILEADRCIECEICVATCPANMDIPDYIRAVRNLARMSDHRHENALSKLEGVLDAI